MIKIKDALLSLRPGAEWTIRDNDYNQLEWHSKDSTKPSKNEIETEIKRLQKEYELTEYRRQRAVEYPDIGDQLDALFHAGVFPDEMHKKIQEVKKKYPKNIIPSVENALYSLVPGADWSVKYNTDGSQYEIEWLSKDIKQPSAAAIAKEVHRLAREYPKPDGTNTKEGAD